MILLLKKNKGLTLIELLISFFILSIIIFLGFSQVRYFKQKTWRKDLKAQLSIYHKNFKTYYITNDDIPSSREDLELLFFPIGEQIYNIGFSSTINSHKLCGNSFDKTISPKTRTACRFSPLCRPEELALSGSMTKTSVTSSATGVIGYAVGDVLKPKNCDSADNKKDKWTVDISGTFNNTQDALE